VEIESNDRSESPLEKIKHDYFELIYRLKNMMASKDRQTQVLNPIIDYSISVVRTVLKTIKSYDEKKTHDCMMKMALMDKKVVHQGDRSSNPSNS
jgi:hypothetical protein